MRKLLFFLIFPFSLIQAQINFLDAYPQVWLGQTSLFAKNDTVLKSQGLSKTETIACFTQTGDISLALFEISVKCDFSLSTSNYFRWQVAGDSTFPNHRYGLFVKWNPQKNNLVLMQTNAGSDKVLAESRLGIIRNGKFIKVRIALKQGVLDWHTDSTASGTYWVKEGSVEYSTGNLKDWSGCIFSHTATRAKSLSVGGFWRRANPFCVKSISFESADSLKLLFSAKADVNSIPVLTPYSIRSFFWQSDSILAVSLLTPLPVNKKVAVFLSGVWNEHASEEIRDTLDWRYQHFYQWHEIRISELMPDPDENGVEFTELINLSEDTLNLLGWKFCDASSCTALPSMELAPGKRMELSERTLSSTLPSLNNAGDQIRLYSSEGVLVDEINYQTFWWGEVSTDGHSIELSDVYSECIGYEIWQASSKNGGTPGQQNEAEENRKWLRIEAIQTSTGVQLIFSLPMKQQEQLFYLNHIAYSGEFSSPYVWNSSSPVELDEFVWIEINTSFTCYTNLRDTTVKLQPALNSMPGDWRITELLFNPIPYGVDFVELTNVSTHRIYLDTLVLCDSTECFLVPFNRSFEPDTKLVLTSDTIFVKLQYASCEAVFRNSKLPAMPDESGVVVIRTKSSTLDSVVYQSDFHSPLLEEEEGVSLERIQYQGAFEQQWISSPEKGSPGCRISLQEFSGSSNWLLSSRIISPDADRRDDWLTVSWNGDDELIRAYVRIYSLSGELVKEMASGAFMQKGQYLIWEGYGVGGRLMPGWYVLDCKAETEASIVQERKVISLINSP
jgi:hypothetical protein